MVPAPADCYPSSTHPQHAQPRPHLPTDFDSGPGLATSARCPLIQAEAGSTGTPGVSQGLSIDNTFIVHPGYSTVDSPVTVAGVRHLAHRLSAAPGVPRGMPSRARSPRGRPERPGRRRPRCLACRPCDPGNDPPPGSGPPGERVSEVVTPRRRRGARYRRVPPGDLTTPTRAACHPPLSRRHAALAASPGSSTRSGIRGSV